MILRLSRCGFVWFAFGYLAIAVVPAQAQQHVTIEDESWLEWLNPFKPNNPNQPVSIPELCKRLDCVAERMRDDGLVVLKQPDVFSQARMTRFRNDFENQMSTDLANFHLVLAARINRLDAATTTQSTALSTALAAPGTTNLPTPLTLPPQSVVTNSGTSLFGSTIPTQSPFSNLGLAPNTLSAAATATGLGVDPTVYLDEKKRFLEHLNHLRRINLGPDQNDSSGYGLYLVRLPVSITPGEKTYHGFGAEVAMHVEHEFTPDFLPSTFRSLVVNDVVDQLGPFIYEVLRSGFYTDYLKPLHEAKALRAGLPFQTEQCINGVLNGFPGRMVAITQKDVANGGVWSDSISQPILKFILAPMDRLNGDAGNDGPLFHLTAERLALLAKARQAVTSTFVDYIDNNSSASLARFQNGIDALRRGMRFDTEFGGDVDLWVKIVARAAFRSEEDLQKKTPLFALDFNPNVSQEFVKLMRPFLTGLYKTALPSDVKLLNELLGIAPGSPEEAVTLQIAGNNDTLARLSNDSFKKLNNLNLPSVRTAKQFYPIAPRELLNFYLEENIYLLAKEAMESSRTKEMRLSDVRNYLRTTLTSAYYVMSTRPQQRFEAGAGAPALPPLDQEDFLHDLLQSVWRREFKTEPDASKSNLEAMYDRLLDSITRGKDNSVAGLPDGRANVRGQALGALCWAIALDATLLDQKFQASAGKTLAVNLENVHFYHTGDYYRANPQAAGAIEAFQDFVRKKWPIITFGLDPVTDQQNIADSYNLSRDLQLAVSYAFATGQIGFNSLSTFRRQIQQSSDAIALNRTVTGFVHGDDIFGFRFTPRFQNPPNQRTNFGVIASQLIGGGPGPDYQVKKSKLESGIREVTAVILVPSFLTEMRLDVTSNWFRLNDPEHLVFHSKRAMEQGRKVQDLRRTLLDPCSEVQYRDVDRRVLRSKLDMVEAMLPWQTKVVQLPFENSASGFDLFSDGSTALVPELTGFSGVDVITTAPATTGAPGAVVAGTPGLQIVNSLQIPSNVTTTSIVGGASSIADVFVFGKYISLLDTKVIAGGRAAAFEILSREVVHVQIPANFIPTTTEEGKQYVEVYLATPNGITNSLLIPYQPPGAAPSANLFDLSTKTTSADVYYQWMSDNNTSKLIATVDPGAKATIDVSWDDGSSLGPKALVVTFQGTVGGQLLSFQLAAQPGNSGDFSVSQQQFTLALLNALKSTATAPGALTSPVSLTLWVQPWVPSDSQGVRTRTEPKKLKTPLNVNLYYKAGDNALNGMSVPSLPPAPGQAARGMGTGSGLNPTRDAGLVRTAQSTPTPPAALAAPQPPAPLNAPSLLSPNVTNEAEQVARVLTGKPFDPNATIPMLLPTAPAIGASATPTPVSSTTTATTSTSVSATPIVVMPAPVVVLPSKGDVKATHRKSRLHPSTMLRNLGNRINQMTP
jgi:hypothetical protein